MRLSSQSMRMISLGILECNKFYRMASFIFEEAVDRLEDTKLLNTLQPGSDEYNMVKEEYIALRFKRRNHKR